MNEIFFVIPLILLFTCKQMADQRPTSVSKMIKDLRSETEAYRRSSSSSNSFPLRRDSQLHRASTSKQEESLHETPKRPKLDDTAVNGSLNKSDAESVPGSPWEWRKMKGEVSKPRAVNKVNSNISQHENISFSFAVEYCPEK